ncbi:hypothetical protein TNCV_3836251 [Trichonephila clavipes]|nr:hypothetical protein TNCV_3836251 [Trichonephila clavipes]
MPYPVKMQKSKLVTLDGLKNFECRIVVGHKFCHQSQCGFGSGGESRQPVCGKLQIVSRLARSRLVPHSVLVLLRAKRPEGPVESPPAERVSLLERIPTSPAKSPPLEMMDFLVNEVEVTPRISTPPLITRYDKTTQTDPPNPSFQTPLKEAHGTSTVQ